MFKYNEKIFHFEKLFGTKYMCVSLQAVVELQYKCLSLQVFYRLK